MKTRVIRLTQQPPSFIERYLGSAVPWQLTATVFVTISLFCGAYILINM